MKLLSLTIDNTRIPVPPSLPSGGLDTVGNNIIQVVFNYFSLGVGIVAMIFIMYAGIQMIISGGDKQKLQAARNRLTYAIVGFIIVICAFVIVNMIILILGGNPSFFFPF